MTAALRAGVVGTGALGRHHVRILGELEDVELVGAFDLRPEVAAELVAQHGGRVFGSVAELGEAADAVVVAVPTASHGEVAIELLQLGCHVMVEKPLAADIATAQEILEACRPDQVLAVGHVEFYNPAVQHLLAQGGAPRYLEIERLAEFTPRSLDIDVILDLMIHDLQIFHALADSAVADVRAVGVDVLSDKVDIANVRIETESGCVANLTASRVSAERSRFLRVFTGNAYYSVDYQEQSIKGFRLLDKDGSRSITGFAPDIEKGEPLKLELSAFLARCRGEDARYVDGVAGLQALETALEIVDAVATK